ncbi:hypothetical protein Ahy_A02g005039 isoform A [Arachis hypogaea]|uniref:Protein kinase domain-containing protein n=1 Tax=Arachis hypogaea TaxID=3818 RepID=A0A445E5T8_ARAHY|nr:hypothetical protein Ahy_A02g005039 isoform A [Arachis hypogaea]
MDAGFNRNHSSEVSSPVAGHFPGYMDYQVGMRPQIPVERKWALGIQVEERGVPVEELLEADEVFCTGTVVVINPVFSVVCYLNNYGKDFNDGLFRFRDGQPMSIMPMAGDVLMYTAEQRNIHSVDEVYSIVLLSCMPLLTWPCLAKGVAVGISIAGTSGVLPLLICACVRYFQKKEKEKIKLPTEDFISSSTQDASSSGEYETLGSTAASASGLPAIMAAKSMEFSYQELAEATNNFSSDNKIGQGRFAAVYFAELRGQLVKINTKSPQTTKRWWSHEGINMSALKDIRKSLIILWRFHLNCSLSHTVPVYIHRDVKPATILIYKYFREKVANFGLTKLREVGSFLSLHTRLVGTFGYMPPVGSKCFNQLKVVMGAAPTILLAIKSEENKLQEVMVGLAANVFTFMSSQESSYVFQEAGIIEVELASILVHILKKHKYPATKVLRIRRFAIEFAIWMMKDKAENIDTFKHMGMEKVLEGVLEITSELESFNVFSGTVGLNRHNLTIHSLVETAFKLLENR